MKVVQVRSMSGNAAPPAVSRPCHLFLALHRGGGWEGFMCEQSWVRAVCNQGAVTQHLLLLSSAEPLLGG